MAPPEKADRMLFRTANTYIYHISNARVRCNCSSILARRERILRDIRAESRSHTCLADVAIPQIAARIQGRADLKGSSHGTLHAATHVASYAPWIDARRAIQISATVQME